MFIGAVLVTSHYVGDQRRDNFYHFRDLLRDYALYRALFWNLTVVRCLLFGNEVVRGDLDQGYANRADRACGVSRLDFRCLSTLVLGGVRWIAKEAGVIDAISAGGPPVVMTTVPTGVTSPGGKDVPEVMIPRTVIAKAVHILMTSAATNATPFPSFG